MDEHSRGKSNSTNYEETKLILKLTKATKNDIFCDLGCGNGNVCRWASKFVKLTYGTEDSKQRFRSAIKNIKKYQCKNIKILNANHRYEKTLKILRKCSIFYTTGDESLGFFMNLENFVNPKTRIVSYYVPPYPIKPNSFEGWFYLMITPFTLARSKREWVRSVTTKRSLDGLIKETKFLIKEGKRDLKDHEDRILGLKERITSTDSIKKKMLTHL